MSLDDINYKVRPIVTILDARNWYFYTFLGSTFIWGETFMVREQAMLGNYGCYMACPFSQICFIIHLLFTLIWVVGERND